MRDRDEKNCYITFLFLIAVVISAQNSILQKSSILSDFPPGFGEKEKSAHKVFTTINGTFVKKQTDEFNYPLNNGDFWEYVEEDTTTIFEITEILKFSVTKEVIGDTLMSNSMNYKIVKWENCANSVDRPPEYEYLRKDSTGKVYIFYNQKDNLLFDPLLNKGTIYASHYPGYSWRVQNKYNVAGFGDTLSAIDLSLLDNNDDISAVSTITDNFGLTYYKGDIEGEYYIPEGSFFGGIINDSTYGYLLAKRQEIDWSEFYPLHIGDFWKYEGNSGPIEYIKTVRVIGDTLINNKIFKKLLNEDHTYGSSPSLSLKYFENNTVYRWYPENSSMAVQYKFSACLGDTFPDRPPNDSYFRINDKSYDAIHLFLYPDLSFLGHYFSRGLGLTYSSFELGSKRLTGAVIDGKVYGDTTITSIDEEYDIPDKFELYQNYPNPFNPATTIKFTIPKYSKVTLKVYDLLGREIRTLIDEKKTPGSYNVLFNAKGLSSGVYIYKLNTGKYSVSKKLILLK
ncbi:MAG: T9SS type A sorting domain-containing protein [Ignavibacteria bacterium]